MTTTRRSLLLIQAGLAAALFLNGTAGAAPRTGTLAAQAETLRGDPRLKAKPVRVPVGAPVTLNPQPIPPKGRTR